MNCSNPSLYGCCARILRGREFHALSTQAGKVLAMVERERRGRLHAKGKSCDWRRWAERRVLGVSSASWSGLGIIAFKGLVGGRKQSLYRRLRAATLRVCSRLGTETPGPISFSALRCTASRRASGAPIQTRQQYSMVGCMKPL